MSESLGYGKKLIKAREAAGITAEEISYELRINLSTLKKLEESKTEELPQPAFTKGFINAYCKFLKIESAPILSDYTEAVRILGKEVPAGVLKNTLAPEKFFAVDFLKEKFFPFLIFFLVIAAAFILYSFLGSYEDGQSSEETPKMIEVSPIEVIEDGADKEVSLEAFEDTEPKIKDVKNNDKDASFAVFDEEEAVEKKMPEEKVEEPIEKETVKEAIVFVPTGKHKLVVEPLAETTLYIQTNLDSKPIRASLKTYPTNPSYRDLSQYSAYVHKFYVEEISL